MLIATCVRRFIQVPTADSAMPISGRSRHDYRNFHALMRRESQIDGNRFRLTALAASGAAGVVAFVIAISLLIEQSPDRSHLLAVIRGRGLSDGDRLPQQELAIASLLSSENLAAVIQKADFDQNRRRVGSEELIEEARSALRVDLGRPDEAGVTAITLRWMAENTEAAARLVNLLARQLVSQLQGNNGRAEESSYALAQQALKDASAAVEEARQRFHAALAGAETAAQPLNAPTVAPPRRAIRKAAPPAEAELRRWHYLEQQLSELEGRRATLGDRLMPEHPEMKALDEKIAAIRANLAYQPSPASSNDDAIELEEPTLAPQRPDIRQNPELLATISQLGAELVDAQSKYESAAERERAAWKTLCAVRGRVVIEVEPAVAGASAKTAGWRMWLVAAICGVLCSGLVFTFWPAPKLTFSTIEEVRSATRLPVIVVGRGSLN